VSVVETKQAAGTCFEAMSAFQLARVIQNAKVSSEGKQIQVKAMAQLDQIAERNRMYPAFDPQCKWST
jgi:hypothetical protein